MANELERELRRLSNLKQNQGLTEKELEPIARRNLIVREFKANPIFEKEEEQKLAEEKFRKYLEGNEIESDSDLDTLSSLVYNEVYEKRIQNELNKLQGKDKYPPEHLTKQLVNIQNQKADLKIKLGIDQIAEMKDDLSALQLAQKRVDKYINEHKDEFTIGLGFECEKCKHKNWETFLLYKRVKHFDSIIKHPWFAGRFLFNYEILKDIKENKITKEQGIRYLLCSGQGKFYKPKSEDFEWCTDYISYCLDHWTEITDLLECN